MSLEKEMEVMNAQLRQLMLILEASVKLLVPGATLAPGAVTAAPNAPASTVTPAAASVQGAAATQQPPAAGSVDTDVNGMPWDERIHSGAVDDAGNHKQTSKNVWQKRKGVPAVDFKRIEGEIMASLAGAAAIPSSTAEMQSTAAVGIPAGSNTVAAPGAQPTLVLPVPADINAATSQDCISITQVFAQMHGSESVQGHMAAWKMTSIADLPANLHAQYINYMVSEDAKFATA